MASNDFVVPSTDGFNDHPARNYVTFRHTARIEVLEYRPGSDKTYWKFLKILQGTKESILRQCEELANIGEFSNARLRASIPDRFDDRDRVVSRRVVWETPEVIGAEMAA